MSLQDSLRREHGPGVYLTSDELDWSDPVKVSPRALTNQFNGKSHDISIDTSFDPERLMYGEGFASLGTYDQPLHPINENSHYAGVFLFGVMLKEPGTDVHKLPRQLAHLTPLVQLIAAHQFSLSKNAKSKFCGLMMRTLPVKHGKEQIAEEWHTHMIFGPKYVTKNRAEMLRIPKDTVENLERLDTRKVQSEYLISDSVGSLIQTAPSPKPMSMWEKEGSYVLNDPPPSNRQAEDGELLYGGSYCFHSAAPVPPETPEGQMRTLVFMCYTPSLAV